MKDPILLRKIQKEVAAGNVTASRNGNLTIYKYSQECHHDGRWNSVNRLCRGIIMDDFGEIYARPFPKFFNLGELEETRHENLPWNTGVEVFEKLDGSLGLSYAVNGITKLATPGSMTSEQAVMGTRILHDKYGGRLPSNITLLFEIVYPANQIVVNYSKDDRGNTFLALLGIMELNGKEWHQNRVDQFAEEFGFPRPKRFAINDWSNIPFEENSEGYVALFGNGQRIKIKSPRYVQVHRLLNYMAPKSVIELIRGREYRATLDLLPADLRASMDDIRASVQAEYDHLANQAASLAAHIPPGERKDQALWIQEHAPRELQSVLFMKLSDKDTTDLIWKIVQSRL